MSNELPRLLALQQSRNTQTRDAWESFAGHRQHIMGLLRPPSASFENRLCLLGAGNCNDVDLAVLATQYDWIDLVDWDDAALSMGVQRQLGVTDERIIRHGGVDVTSIAGKLSQWQADLPPNDQQVDELCRLAATAPLPVTIAQADTVASLCLLSQLVELCAAALGPNDPRLLRLIQAVRQGHLRQLAECLRRGGKGVLVVDLVSSVRAPGLAQIPCADLPPLLHRLLNEGNFFTGLHPQALLGDFRADSLLQTMAASCQVTTPWLWQLGPRTYAVFAIIFHSGQ